MCKGVLGGVRWLYFGSYLSFGWVAGFAAGYFLVGFAVEFIRDALTELVAEVFSWFPSCMWSIL